VNKVLMSGNNIIGEAAIRAGCRFYAGYPITPQNELTEYMAEHMRKADGGVFIQPESEIAAINMIAGASATGVRVMTSSSSPGISLKQEGISSKCDRTRRRVSVSPSGRRRMLSVESRPEGSCEDTKTNRPAPASKSSRVVSPLPSSLSKKIEIRHFPNEKCHLAGAAAAEEGDSRSHAAAAALRARATSRPSPR